MNESDRELLQRVQSIVVLAKLRLIEQDAQWRLRIIPGLALTPLLPPLTFVWVVAVDGYPLGRLYRIKPDPSSQQWIVAAYGPPYVKPGVFSTRSSAVYALLENQPVNTADRYLPPRSSRKEVKPMTDSSAQSLYLARHGQTALNAAGRLRGLADPPLDDIGIAEARRLGHALANTGVRLVVSSPLERARHTAQIVAQISGTPRVVDERFNDRDYGPQTGLVKSEVEAQWGSVDAAPGVEPVDSVLARARPALDDLLDEDEMSTVIVITHDALIRPLIATIDPGYGLLQAPTGSWNHLHRAAGLWSIVAVDQLPSAEDDHA